MAKKNSISNASQDITIDPGASGDSFLQFSINGTGEFRIGVDDNDSDKFKISQGSALGTNDTFIMTSSGERTMPLQPAFLAYLASSDSSVTGDGTTFTMGSGNALTEIFDQGGDFNTNGTFTAPITGRYELIGAMRVNGLTSSHTKIEINIVTSNGTYGGLEANPASIDYSGIILFTWSALVDMDSADTATLQVTVSNGTKVAGLQAFGRACHFGGYLVC